MGFDDFKGTGLGQLWKMPKKKKEKSLKTKYRFIYFEEKNTEHGIRYFCKNNKPGDHLGECAFYKKWKEWVYLPEDIVMSSQCLEDVAHFLRQLNLAVK